MGDGGTPGLAEGDPIRPGKSVDHSPLDNLLQGLQTSSGLFLVLTSGRMSGHDGAVRVAFSDAPRASIIIPTLDRPTSLRRCLESLYNQHTRDLEVILVHEKGELAALRNKGAALATTDILIFIDDDVYCPPTWLESILESFTDPSVAGASGPAIITQEFQKNRDIFRFPLIKRAYDLLFLERDAHLPGRITRAGTWTTGACRQDCDYTGEVDYAEACNMAFRRGAFMDCGGFDTRFGGIGDWSEPDLAFRIRARSLGKIWFDRRSALYHEPSVTGAYLSRAQTGARLTNYLLFARRWVKPHWRHTIYKLFLRGYFGWKEIRWRLNRSTTAS